MGAQVEYSLEGSQMVKRRVRHPVFDVLRSRGQGLRWLARGIDMSYWTVRAVKYGRRRGGAIFRARCANFFQLPETMLFRDDADGE